MVGGDSSGCDLGGTIRFVSWTYRIIAMVGMFIMTWAGFALLFEPAEYEYWIVDLLAILLTGVMGYLFLRSLRCASLTLTDRELIVRGLLRTRRLAWREIERVDVGSSFTMTSTWDVPHIRLVNGSVVMAEEIGGRDRPNIADTIACEANRRIDLVHHCSTEGPTGA